MAGWVYDDSPPVAKVIESAGFVTAVTNEVIQITHSRSETGGKMAPLTIPLCCIQDYRTIEL
jgi:hypothetical protein